MIRFSQQDPKWKDKQLGVGEYTIGQAGCLLTCFAIAAQYVGATYTPSTLNDAMVNIHGFAGSLIMPAMVSSIIPSLGIKAVHDCPNTPAPMVMINEYLLAGHIVIVQLDTSPSAGIQSHWVILDKQVGADYSFIDPWPISQGLKTLLQAYGAGRSAAAIITYVIVLDLKRESETPAPVSTEPQSSGNFVTVVSSGVRGRTVPGIDQKVVIYSLEVGLKFEKCSDPPVTKDGHKWQAVKLWVSAGPENGNDPYLK